MATIDQIVDKARTILQDPDGNRWDDDDLKRWINEGQREYVEETYALRAQAPISVKENEDVYTWPDDCLRVLRVEGTNGREIAPTTSAELQRQNGGTWRDDEGTPSHYYSDLDGAGSFRFHPKSDPSFEASGIEFGIDPAQMTEVVSGVGENIFSVALKGSFVYVLGATQIHKLRLNGFSIESSTTHGITIDSDYNSCIRIDPSSETAIWYNNDKIYKTVIGGSTSTHITVALSYVTYLGPITDSGSTRAGAFVFTGNMGTGTKAHYATIADNTPVELTVGGSSIGEAFQVSRLVAYGPWGNVDETQMLIACGDGGFFRWSLVGAVCVQVSSSPCWGVATGSASIDSDNDLTKVNVFVVFGQNIYKYLAGVVADIEDVTPTIFDENTDLDDWSKLYSDADDNLWSLRGLDGIDTSRTRILKLDSTDGSTDSSWYYFPTAPTTSFWATDDKFIYDGVFYAVDAFISFEFVSTSPDNGIVVSISDNPTGLEFGVLVDYNETDDVCTFASDYGVVTYAVDADEIAQVFYVKTPTDDIIEIDDDEALYYYAVAKALEIESDDEALQRSALAMQKFNQRLAREKRRQSREYTKSGHRTVTQYF